MDNVTLSMAIPNGPEARTPGRSLSVNAGLLSVAAGLSDAALLSRVAALAGRERTATVELVAHLAELDSRRLYLSQGFGSLFTYCTGALRLAEHAAYNRIEAARASRLFPRLLDLLADGSLNLSTLRLLAPHLRPDNFERLVAAAGGKSKREVELLVAALAPRPDVPSSVRRLPSARVGGGGHRSTLGSAPAAAAVNPVTPADPTTPPPLASTPDGPRSAILSESANPVLEPDRPSHRPVVAPLAPDRFQVKFTIGTETHRKLRQLQDLLRREVPDGDPGEIFDRALTLLLEDVSRRKFASTTRPREERASALARERAALSRRSRGVPADVKRAVWRRDEGQCAFVATSGRRCAERAFLEFHHCEPYGIGGEATVANVSLRCRAHNVYEAELAFGSDPASETRPGGDTGPGGETGQGGEKGPGWRDELAPGRVGGGAYRSYPTPAQKERLGPGKPMSVS